MLPQDSLYRVVIGAMLLCGGLGIMIFLFSLFFPTRVVEVAESFSQLTETEIHIPIGQKKEHEASKRLQETGFGVADLSTSKQIEEQKFTEPPSRPYPSKDSIAVKIRKLKAQYESYKQEFENKQEMRQELLNLIIENDTKGLEYFNAELRQLSRQLREAKQNGRKDRMAEIVERLHQLPTEFEMYAKNLADIYNTLGDEQEEIAKKMLAVQAEINPLKKKMEESHKPCKH